MSFTSYTNFGTAIATWLDVGYSDLGTSLIADLITVGETRIFREVRSREMETAFTGTMTAGLLALPAGYLALKSAYLNAAPNQSLERRPAEWIRLTYPQDASSGRPKFIARYGTNFIFGPYPDSAYTVNGIFYQSPAVISGAALNTLFTTNPDLYLFACLAESEIVIGRDKRIPVWEGKYQRILLDVNGVSAAEDASGSTLQMRNSNPPSYRSTW